MEVDIMNFEQLLPKIKDTIDRCDFITIYCLSSLFRPTEDDYMGTLEGAYEFLRKMVSQHTILQFGLCAFIYDQTEKEYIHESFTFYLTCHAFKWEFALEQQNPPRLRRFNCDVSLLTDLAGCQFDYNRTIYSGIPYLSDREVRELKVQWDRAEAEPDPTQIRFGKPAGSKRNPDYKRKRIPAPIPVPRFRALGLISPSPMTRTYSEYKKTKRYLHKVKNDEFRRMHLHIGFSKVIRMIRDSKKLVVSGDMLPDICSIVQQFIIDLPASGVSEFKKFVQPTFPNLIDTEYVERYSGLINAKLVQVDLKRNSFTAGSNFEAGFKAFQIGSRFMSMVRALEVCGNLEKSQIRADSASVKPFLNKLFVAENIQFLNISDLEDQ